METDDKRIVKAYAYLQATFKVIQNASNEELDNGNDDLALEFDSLADDITTFADRWDRDNMLLTNKGADKALYDACCLEV